MKYFLSFLLIVFVLFSNRLYAQSDDCSGAVQLTNLSNYCSTNGTYSNATSTASSYAVATCWNSTSTIDVWFKFIAVGTEVLITVNGSGSSTGATMQKPEIVLSSSACGATISEMKCGTTKTTLKNYVTLYDGTLKPGNTYYIRIASSSANKGKFDLCINNYTTVPNPNDPNDCKNATIICNKDAVSVGTFNGAGSDNTYNNPEVNTGCFSVSQESNSNWLTFKCKTSGTLEFDINGAKVDDDIDWMLMEIPAMRNCATKTVLSCNIASCDINGDASQSSGNPRFTGIRSLEDAASKVDGTNVTKDSEVGGCVPLANGYNNTLNIVAGKSYVLFVNNDVASSGFSVKWGGTSTFVGPESKITVNKSTICVGESITVNGSTSIDYSTFKWDLPSEASPTSQTAIGPFSQTFNKTGTFPIILTTYDAGGCLSVKNTLVTVNGINADYTAPTVCSGNPTTFTCTTTGLTGLTWDFGDGTTGTGTPANHSYATPGDYTAKLTVNGGGCSNVISQKVSVLGANLNITPNPAQTCPGVALTLNGTAAVTGNISGSKVFSNNNSVTIPDDGTGYGTVSATWDGTIGSTGNSATTVATSPITVAGLNGSNWKINSITVNVGTNKLKYLILYLETPCGQRIKLVNQPTTSGTLGLNGTIFTPTATTTISGATPIGAGPFKASDISSWNSNLLSCTNPNGTWKLIGGFYEFASYNAASTITNWTIDFQTDVPNTLKTLAWSPLTNLTSPSYTGVNTANGTASASISTSDVITLTAVDQNNCTTTKQVTVTAATPAVPTASGTAICTGNTTTLTATGSTGATFKWYSLATGGTVLVSTASYTTPTLSANTSYWVTQTVGGCESGRTKVDVTINPCVCTPPTITQPTAKTICAGGNTTFSITASGTTNNTFQWQVNTGTGWTNITNGGVYSGATTKDLTITAGTAGMNGYQYQCTAYEATGTCPATSNAVALTVDPTNVGGAITTATTVCTGSTSGLLTLAGNTGAITKWQSAPSPFSTWTDIANTTATYTSGALTQTTQFRAVIQSGSCPAVNSSPVTITVDQNNIGGTVTTSKTICPNATSGLLTLGGNTGAVIKWQSAISPFTTWTDISNTALTYTSGPLSQTTHFRAVVKSGTCPEVNSTPAEITVGTVQTLNIQCGTSTTSSVQFTWTNITDATSYSYSYTINGAGTPVTNTLTAGTTTFTVNGLSASQTVNFTLTPVGSQCAVQETHDCVAINCPTPTVTQVSDVTLCSGETLSTINFASPQGATVFNWSNTNTSFGLAPSGNTSIGTITVGNVLTPQTALISVNATSGGCTGPTMTFNINVNPLNTITLNSAVGTDGQTVCVNSAITNIGYITTGATGATFSGLPSGVTGNFNSGVITITGIPTTIIGSPFTYTITLTGGCGTITKTGTITVNTINTITLSSAVGTDAQTVCINTAITNITYTTTGATGATFTGLPSGVTGNWNANSVTISGSPTTIVGSPFSYTIDLTGGCGIVNTTGAITVNPLNTIILSSAVNSDNQSICLNGSLNNLTYTTTGATGATFSGLPSGITGSWNNDVISITGTPTSNVGNPFTYTINLVGGCGPVSKTGNISIITINTITLTSAAGTDNQTICQSSPINTITYTTTGASGATISNLPPGVNGSWNNNTISISGFPSTTVGSPFNYTIDLTGGCGTVGTTGTITINPIKTLTLTSLVGSDEQTICANSAIKDITYATTNTTGATITGLPNGVTGNWNNNIITITGTPLSNVNNSFTYTIDLIGGCGNVTATGKITIISINTITLTSAIGTNNQTICENSAINAITYTTTGATGATITNLPAGVSGSWINNVITFTGSPTSAIGSPFTYTIDLTGGCGTVGTTGKITVNPTNTINLTSAAGTDGQTICVNSALTNITYATKNATGATISGLPAGVTGNWNSNVFTITGTPTSNIQTTYNYTITLTGGCGLVTAQGSIEVNPLNTITLSSAAGTDKQVICINTALNTITYTITGATGANVTNLPNGISANWNSNSVTISGVPTQSGNTPYIYNIELTGGCGILNKTGSITVNPENVITLTSAVTSENQAVCTGNAITTITYTTSGATGATITGLPSSMNGNWNNNQITISGSSTNTTNSPYNYLITLTGGCGNITDNGTIIINPLPVFIPSSNTPCEATTLNLNANFNGATSYSWTGPNSFNSNVENPSIANVLTAQSGVYNLRIIDNNGCIQQQSVAVTINPMDLIIMSPISNKCQKDNVFFLYATPAGGVWSGDGITNPVTGEFNPDGLTTKLMPTKNVVNYTTIGTTCPNSRSFDIEINANPIVDFVAEKVDLCEGDTLILHSLTTPSNVSIVWDFGNGVNSIDEVAKYVYKTGGVYDIKQIATINGCKTELIKSDYINVVSKPTNVQFTQSTNTLDLYNPIVSFSTNTEALYYHWSFGDSKSSNVKNPTHQFPSEPENYLVTLTASNILNHCSNSISHIIVMPEPVIYFIPNTFTPNGDEYNNTFQPIFTMGYDPQNYSFYIYNRWGEIIFESHDTSIGWDGTYGEKMLKGDTFVWKLTFKEKNTSIEHNETGHVNILR